MQLGRVQDHPGENGGGLPDDVLRRAEEPRGLLRQPPERVVPERAVQFRTTMLQLARGFGYTPS